jgi:AcrR family transcriptional regulator
VQSTTPTRATDPRPARTRAAVYAAVEQLAADRSADVSVNAIVRAAGVSRSAFYAQFADLEQLAVAMLIDAFREIGTADVEARHEADADAGTIARTATHRLTAYIDHRRAFYRASLDWRVTSRVHEVVVEAYADQVRATMTAMGGAVPAGIDRDDVARFVAGGAVSLLTSWIRTVDGAAPDAMAERLLAVMPGWLTGTD